MKRLFRLAAVLGVIGRVALLSFSTAVVHAAPPVGDSAQSSGNTASGDDPGGSEDAPNPPKKIKRDKFRRSRLTNDQSEMTSDRRKMLLTTGEDKAVDLDFEANAGANGIAIGNPQVVATTLVKVGEKRQIVFKPLKAGDTTVTVRDQDGTLRLIFNVTVSGSDLLKRSAELRDLLREVDGIEIRIVGEKILVDGEVLVPADYARVISVLTEKPYSEVVLNLVSLSKVAMALLAKRIQEDIIVFAPNVKTRLVNGIIFLEGTVDSLDQAKRSADVALLYLPEVKPGNPIATKDPSAQILPPRSLVKNFIIINPPPPRKQEKLVRVTAYFVELAKDYSKVFGFKWQPGFTADPTVSIGQKADGTVGAGSSSPFTATISSFFPRLQSAQNSGYARILKTATLVTRSGQPAELNEQTDYPYTTLGPNGQAVGASKPVGLSISVTPQILGQSEDIQMDLDLSQIDLVGRAVSGVAPITSNHKIKTKLYVKSNESAAVGGVVSADVGTQFNKDDPQAASFSGQTDPLFTLLHSKAFQKKKSQFVIFITPQIVESASEGTEDLKKNFRVKVK